MQQTKWWQQLHWREYFAELLGTALMIFVGLSAVIFNMGQGLPMEKLLPNQSWRLLLTGIIFAGSGSLVAISPLGKLSGGHVNPSVSLAFWLQGQMHGHDFICYVIAQFIGAIAGEFLLVSLWQNYAQSVNNGMTLPGQDYALWYVFIAEVLITFLGVADLKYDSKKMRLGIAYASRSLTMRILLGTRNRNIPEFKIMNKQSNRMFEHCF